MLGRPLHHGPTKGGDMERMKFNDWYDRTRESYRRFFGQDPPADIWPAADIRFGEDIHYRRVNSQRCWIIRKPKLPKPGLARFFAACTSDPLQRYTTGHARSSRTAGARR